MILTRPLAVKHLDSKTEKTNAEGLVGQTAVVLLEINNLKETGQAKINGMEWTARAKNNEEVIPADEAVRVVDIQGVKLIVERITPSESKEEAKIELDDDVIKTV